MTYILPDWQINAATDANLGRLNDAIDDLDDRASGLEDSLDGINSGMAGLSTAVGVLDVAFPGLNDTVTSLDSTVSSLDGTVTSLAASVTSLNTAITGLDTRVSALETTVAGLGSGGGSSAALDPVQAAAATAVPIYPTDVAQTIVDAQPAGTTFVIKTGTHTGFTLTLTNPALYSGMRFIGEPGTVLDGAGANLRCLTTFATDVVFRGWSAAQPMQINNYTPTTSQATVVNCNSDDDSRDSLPGCEIAYLSMLNNAQVNVRGGASSNLHDLTITNAGMNALAGAGIGSPFKPCIVKDVTIVNNNSQLINPGFEGGIKFSLCRYVDVSNVTIIGNPVHASACDSWGLWFDVSCEHVVVRNCTISDVPRAGIIMEIGGSFQLFGNTISNCGFAFNGIGQGHNLPAPSWGYGGGAGILVASTGNGPLGVGGYISKNTLTNCNEGIVIREQNRGVFSTDELTPLFSQNIRVLQNSLSACGGSGVLTDILQWSSSTTYALYAQVYSNGMLFTSKAASNLNNAPPTTPTSSSWWTYSCMNPADPSRNLIWNRNAYTGSCGPTAQSFSPSSFYWTAASGGSAHGLSAWQSYGQDINGTYS